MQDSPRRYRFDWGLLGDIEAGRPNLGATTHIEAYRLMKFCFWDGIEQHVGTGETDEILYGAGHLAAANCTLTNWLTAPISLRLSAGYRPSSAICA